MIPNADLKVALSEFGILPQDQLEDAIKSADARGQPLGDFLVDHDIISDENLGRIVADLHGIPFVDLSAEIVAADVIGLAPVEMIRRNLIFPFRQTDQALLVATADPNNLEALAALRKKAHGKKLRLFYATRRDIELAASSYHPDIRTVFQGIITEVDRKLAEKAVYTSEAAMKDVPVVDMVATLLLFAHQSNASDLHIEPQEKDVLARLRIDGIMHDVVRYPKYMHDLIVTRLKIMARLRTDEHFAAQDGKIRTVLEGEAVDIRINVVPIIEGEKVVMRLLTERGKRFYLDSVGLSAGDLAKVQRAIRKPFGMILATGPTGSGKTTTLYAVMKLLNTSEVNITTIEDPIEYDIGGVNQIQVNPKTGITFAAGLRAIVRQNPDIIMVGEIRDEETASIAVNAAMTGHLVLSTLHTNNAATAVPRLLDMKVEPFLIASSINVVIAQRLVRRICPKCRRSRKVDVGDGGMPLSDELRRRIFGNGKTATVYEGAKCPLCRQTGYLGRVGIFEVIEMGEAVRALIMKRADADEIEREAVRQGMSTMLEDGVRKVLAGLTTIEEILRVTRD